MRNPLNSWAKSDSYETHVEDNETLQIAPFEFFVGDNDLALMKKLCKAGAEHRKFMRQIFVSMDIVAARYWWVQFDTFKIGVTANSTSTMHTIHKKPFELDDFSHERMKLMAENSLIETINTMNIYREEFLRTGDKEAWYQMIQLLPQSYNQRRTIVMNYENVVNMIRQRSGHKLNEWAEFVDVLKQLPYIAELTEE